MGTFLLLCGLGLGWLSNPWGQVVLLLLGWLLFYRQYSRVAQNLMLLLSLGPLACSPSQLNSLGISLYTYYDLIQCSPVYAIFRLLVDPWTLPWIYDDSPFHFRGESSRLLVAPVLLILYGLGVLISSAMTSKRAKH